MKIPAVKYSWPGIFRFGTVKSFSKCANWLNVYLTYSSEPDSTSEPAPLIMDYYGCTFPCTCGVI